MPLRSRRNSVISPVWLAPGQASTLGNSSRYGSTRSSTTSGRVNLPLRRCHHVQRRRARRIEPPVQVRQRNLARGPRSGNGCLQFRRRNVIDDAGSQHDLVVFIDQRGTGIGAGPTVGIQVSAISARLAGSWCRVQPRNSSGSERVAVTRAPSRRRAFQPAGDLGRAQRRDGLEAPSLQGALVLEGVADGAGEQGDDRRPKDDAGDPEAARQAMQLWQGSDASGETERRVFSAPYSSTVVTRTNSHPLAMFSWLIVLGSEVSTTTRRSENRIQSAAQTRWRP